MAKDPRPLQWFYRPLWALWRHSDWRLTARSSTGWWRYQPVHKRMKRPVSNNTKTGSISLKYHINLHIKCYTTTKFTTRWSTTWWTKMQPVQQTVYENCIKTVNSKTQTQHSSWFSRLKPKLKLDKISILQHGCLTSRVWQYQFLSSKSRLLLKSNGARSAWIEQDSEKNPKSTRINARPLITNTRRMRPLLLPELPCVRSGLERNSVVIFRLRPFMRAPHIGLNDRPICGAQW